MLRLLLSTIFLLASSIPAFADSPWSCTWCRARGGSPAALQGVPASIAVAEPPVGMDGAMAFSVIYPGIVVLMTMTAHFFLKAMEPQARHDHPGFVRGAAGLSALWLIGFYPFLTSALGGFLFCLTAVACTAGWLTIRRFGLQTRLWEKLAVFWSFFFFSLLAGAIVTGYGRNIGAVFEQSWNFSRDTGISAGPLLMLAINAGALWLIFRVMGLKVPRPTSAESIMRAKVYALVIAVAIFDTIAAGSHSLSMGWVAWPLLALPSLAYYGVYWLVVRLPSDVRERVSLVLFVLLALFLVLLSCLAAGASAQVMLLAAAALGVTVSSGLSLTMLWRSGTGKAVKVSLSLAAAAFLLGAGYLAFTLGALPPLEKDAFIRDRLVLELLGWKSLAGLLLAYGCGIFFILSAKFSSQQKYALAAVMIFFLLSGYATASRFMPASLGAQEQFALKK